MKLSLIMGVWGNVSELAGGPRIPYGGPLYIVYKGPNRAPLGPLSVLTVSYTGLFRNCLSILRTCLKIRSCLL